MAEPVKNNPVGVIPPKGSAGGKKIPVECPLGDYLDIGKDGEWTCFHGALEGLIGDAMSCGERGGIPCDFGKENLREIPIGPHRGETTFPAPIPPPQDQFRPAEPKVLKEILSGKAEYACKIGISFMDYWTITQNVFIPGIPGEPTAGTAARFEQAARDLAKTIGGCRRVEFERLTVFPSTSPRPEPKPNEAIVGAAQMPERQDWRGQFLENGKFKQ